MRLVLASYHRAITLAAALVCSLLIAAPTSGDKIKRTVPLSAAAWTVDLRQYGWPQTYFPYRLWATFHTSDVFLNDDQLIATTVTHWPVEGLQRRDDPHHQYPYVLHAIVLDAASGRPRMTYSWGSDFQQIGVVRGEDGGFAVFLGDRIDFYAADLTPRGELSLPMVTDLKNFDVEGIVSFSYSPSGKTMLVQYDDSHGPACVLMRGEAISEIREACEPVAIVRISPDFATHVIGIAVSDEEMAGTDGNDPESMHVRIRALQGTSKNLFSGPVWFSQFVTDDTLLVREVRSFRFVRSDGKTIWRQDAVHIDNQASFYYSYAQQSGLFGIPVHDTQDSSLSGVVVFDEATHKPTFRVNTNPKDNRLRGLSISPDGKRLVIDIGWVLRSYDLPPRQK